MPVEDHKVIKENRFASYFNRLALAVGAATVLLVTTFSLVSAQSPAALSIGGLVKAPQSFTLADLQKLPWTTVDATFQTEHGSQHGTWLGVSLWTLLDHAGGVDASMKDSVRHWLVVTGRDGYAVALSVGEIDPSFGHAAAVVAWSHDGQSFDPKAGLRLILPGDRYGARDVRDVVGIEVK